MATRFHCSTFVTKEKIRAAVGISVEISETDQENQEGTQCRATAVYIRLEQEVGTSVPISTASYPEDLGSS
jgi:hypothetical protein